MAVRLSRGIIFGTFIGVLSIALYPVFINPYMNIHEYKQIQKISRQGINQEEIQPGNMPVWRDPFGRK